MNRIHNIATAAALIGTVCMPLWGEPAMWSASPEALATLRRARYLMGSTLTLTLRGVEDPSIAAEVFEEVARLESLLSNWDPSSEISRLNRMAGDRPVVCTVDLFNAIASAIQWADATSGAFDPTVEPLVRRPRAGSTLMRAGKGETTQGSQEDLSPIGHHHVQLDAGNRSIRFDASGVGIDLGGLGKGIALDAVAKILTRRGVEGYLLDFGGQVLARGGPTPGEPWRVGLADPADRLASIAQIAIRSGSIATSGRLGPAGPEQIVEHILDPADGRPAKYTGSVTVFASDATSADALSTALFVMGPAVGIPWAQSRGIEALYIDREGSGRLRYRATPAFPAWSGKGRMSTREGPAVAVPSRGKSRARN